MTESRPPYLRIVAEIERRIETGELRPGDSVPTTRAIVHEWGVAMATATKALAALKQSGSIESRPRVGAVVATRRLPARTVDGFERDRILRVAIRIADTGGLAALSLRAVAADLGVATISLHRHLETRTELPQLIADFVFTEIEYPEPPKGWRAHLRTAAQLQWGLYQRHPWLPRLISITRPTTPPGMMAYGLWTLRAFDGMALDPSVRLHVYATLMNYVRGTGINIESETGAELDTGMTSSQWGAAKRALDGPLVSQITGSAAEVTLDSLFAFGLERLLDGMTTVLAPRKARP
ncbi:GntR family transcriptional regulator [Nocardia callitridis]|uniref:TetR/AcrR family transcriptional regulator C-terminal domain-containing protein n=1 Tax=Nocardia callitridis TaxID=648753 RepID=A0ABP9KV82_9NOCA